MTPDQIAKTERKRAGGKAAAAEAAAEKAAGPPNLDDAATQFRILNPDEMRYSLHLADGSVHEIAVKTAFTMHDIHEVRVLDQLESLSKLVSYEIAQVDGPMARSGSNDLRGLRLDIAMSRPNVREEARAVLARLSRFVVPFDVPLPQDAPAGSIPVRREVPTLQEIAYGMESSEMLAASLYLVNRYYDEVEKRKNARRTAQAQA